MPNYKNLIKISSTLAVCFCITIHANFCQAQNTTPAAFPSTGRMNYTRVWTATAPDASSTHLVTRSVADVKQVTEYFDGFGRPTQTVSKQITPLGNDLVAAKIYDATTTNEIYRYNPFAETNPATGDLASDGNFKLDRFHEQVAFYNSYLNNQTGETTASSSTPNWAYNKTIYESSPVARELTNFSPGVNWVGTEGGSNHSNQMGYLVNTATDNVVMWTAATNKSSTNQFTTSPVIPTYQGIYPANTLVKSILTDEGGHQVIEYKDQFGQLILKKVQNSASEDPGSGSAHAGFLCTYYVYDDYGNLRFMITPNVVQLIDGNWSAISQSYIDELCYYFEYDNQNRVVIRKNPGTPGGINGEQWMVYDQRGRLVMQQDGNQRASQKWKFFQYDGLDRIIGTGFITDPSANLLNYNDLINHVNTASSSSSYPVVGSYSNEILLQSFYDNYSSWMNASNSSTLGTSINNTSTDGSLNSNFLSASNSASPYAQSISQSAMTRGMLVGSKLEVLGTNGGQYIYNVDFYDAKGRLIQAQTINSSGGLDIATNQYDWSGKLLVNLVSQTLSSASNPQTHKVASIVNYDPAGRLTTINKTISSTINGVAVTASSLIEANVYNELSMLQKKTFGNNLESMTYDYNVRGWTLGANRDYTKTALSTTNYFGFDLGYDQGTIAPGGGASIGSYTSPAYTGNIAGTVWKSKSDGIIRKFDYTYDNPRRLMTAPFNESATVNTWSNTTINFSVGNISYDNNGNLGSAQRYGFMVGGSQMIDDISYNYNIGKDATTGANFSNRLQNVTDNSNNSQSALGDLHYPSSPVKTVSSTDYGYDASGNITSDYNRNISAVSYQYDLNLPNLITVPNKGTIQYTYDAGGNKLQKQSVENNVAVSYNGNNYTTNITTTTKYVDGFIYKTVSYSNPSLNALNTNNTDVLISFGHEQGRVRYIPGATPKFVFDYFMRDHLGSVRMVLTDEQQTDPYPPTSVETVTQTVNGVTSSPAAFESQYYNIIPGNIVPVSGLAWWSSVTNNNYVDANASVPVNDPYATNPTTTASANLYKLSGWNGTSGNKTGLAITLKVMAGDVVNIYGKSVWHNTTTTSTYQPITSSLLDFFTALATSQPVAALHGAVTANALNGATATTTPLAPMLNGTPGQTANTTYAPKAAINWILFDDQFRPVANSMGTSLVSSTSDLVNDHSTGSNAIPTNISMSKSGYLYVFCSNESNIDVYFDNLQVTLKHGPMEEENHYYPYGLTMNGISDKAWGKSDNNFHFQGNEMQNHEWYDGTGLEEYDFNARYYDQQLGIWHNQDPVTNAASPYAAMANNPAMYSDANGKCPLCVVLIIAAVAGAYSGASIESGGHWNPAKWNSDWWKGAVAGAIIADAAVIGATEVISASYGVTALGAAWPVALSASEGVAQNLVMTGVTDVELHQSLNADQLLTASVTGAISGAFQSSKFQDFFDQKWDWAGKLPDLYKGATSNIIGGALSTAAKDAIGESSWKSFLNDEYVSAFSQAAGQITHTAFTNWIKDSKVDRIVYNTGSAISQSFVNDFLNHASLGNFNSDLGTGTFTGSIFWSNLLPTAFFGWNTDNLAARK